jgi:predicted PurR-regulated permease PerM
VAASKPDDPQTGAIAHGVALAALAAVVLWASYLARNALLIIYISGLLAIGFGPVVRAIEHQTVVPVITRRLPRWLAILLVYIVIVGALTTVGLLVVPPLVDQAQELWTRIPVLLERGQTFLMRYGLLTHRITLEEAVRGAPSSSGTAMDTVATAVTSVVGGLFGFLTIFVLTFYLLLESDTLFVAFARLFPRDDRPRVKEAARKISTKVSAWLNGQLILAGTIGASAAVGLYLLGVPYFYVLALIAAFGEMIPVIGPILSAIPAVLAALTVSPKTALFVLIFFLVQQQVENHLLVPKVMERQVGVSAVTVISALLIGGAILGITGALLAVPSAAILQVLVQELLDERDALQPDN